MENTRKERTNQQALTRSGIHASEQRDIDPIL